MNESEGVEPSLSDPQSGVLPLDDDHHGKMMTGPSDEEPVEGNQGAGHAYPGLVLRSDSAR